MTTISTQQLHQFQGLDFALKAMLGEFEILRGVDASGQDSPVSEAKHRAIVSVTSQVTDLLGDEAPAIRFSDIDQANFKISDVTVLLGQWAAAMHVFQNRRTVSRYGRKYWRVKDGDNEVEYVPVKDDTGVEA